MNLADLGADVIKVERPGLGDDTRSWGPPWSRSGESTYYLGLNRGKRSVVLDFEIAHDRRLALRLAERADVLIENFRPGFMTELGLGYEEVAAANPGIIYSSVSGFGSRGPTADLPGYDLLIQAMSGLMSITGPDEGTPMKVGAAVTDMITGLYATIGILAALHERAATGRGRLVEISLFDAALNGLLNQGSAFLNTGVVPHAQGNRHPSIAPYEAFEASDRLFILAAANDKLWEATCRAIGCEHLLDDERFVTNARRRTNVGALAKELGGIFKTRTADEWITRLREAGVPAGPINQVDEAFSWAADNGLHRVVELDGVRTVSSPIRVDGEALNSRLRPPALDEHGDDIRAWLEDDR